MQWLYRQTSLYGAALGSDVTTPNAPVLPGPIRQIGFVVNNLQTALQSWDRAGRRPWYVVSGQRLTTLYRGEPCEVTLTIALANSGEIQLEVLPQDGGDPNGSRST